MPYTSPNDYWNSLDHSEKAHAVAEATREHGSINKAAAALNISRRAAQRAYKYAALTGLLGTEPVLPYFQIKKTSAELDADGNVTKEWVQQTPEHGEVFEIPEGQMLKGVSALVDPDGRTILKWVKTRQDDTFPVVYDAIKAAFESYSGARKLRAPKSGQPDDTLNLYPIADLHLGMFAWARETGSDYDLKIAADALRNALNDLVSRSLPARRSVVLDLGDYFHSDNSMNRTMRSGNALDIDTRYSKVVQVGFELTIEAIELALQKHERVEYRKLPGNHDEESSKLLAIAIAAHFRNEKRVTVDLDPSRFWMMEHGQTLLSATHGDMLKMGDMAGFIAAQYPEAWGRTKKRYGFTGHVHNEKALAMNTLRGLKAESLNSLAAKDWWHAGEGYQSPRDMIAISYDLARGEIDRITHTV